MNIKLSKVKRQLEKNYGWSNLDCNDKKWFVDELIKDTIRVINDELIIHKNITIKK